MKVCNNKTLEKVLSFIKTYQIANGRSPSYRQIMKGVGLSSLSMVQRYVKILQEQNLIQKNNAGNIDIASNLSLGQTIIAPVVGTVTCGTPIYAQENIESIYALPAALFGAGKTFILHAEGDSMIGKGIKSGDLLVVKQCETADDGDVVVALLDDSATVKTFFKKKKHVVLHPENEKYKDIITRDVQILGKVEYCIHELWGEKWKKKFFAPIAIGV